MVEGGRRQDGEEKRRRVDDAIRAGLDEINAGKGVPAEDVIKELDADAGYGLDAAERAKLHRALKHSWNQARSGRRGRSLDELLKELEIATSRKASLPKSTSKRLRRRSALLRDRIKTKVLSKTPPQRRKGSREGCRKDMAMQKAKVTAELWAKVAQFERKCDRQFKIVFDAIRQMKASPKKRAKCCTRPARTFAAER